MPPRLELSGINKAYPGVIANDNISFSVQPGEIHAVLGENGAGKSTLMKIIYGAISADSGEIRCDGKLIKEHGPAVSRGLGIEMVYQHFALFESISVVENIALSMPDRMNLPALSAEVRTISKKYGLPIDPNALVLSLSMGERQRVEIIRCLLRNPKLLILDEPTSVLTPQAVQILFETLHQLAQEGCSILYISHKLDEVRTLCHTATVLRGGHVTGRVDPSAASASKLARLMVGHELEEVSRPATQKSKKPLFEVRELRLAATNAMDTALQNLNMEVFGGEIVGIAGVAGNGQNELAAAMSGETVNSDPDAILLESKPVAHLDAGQRRDLGFGFIPEERLGRGAIPPYPLSENALLTAHRQGMTTLGFTKRHRAKDFAAQVIRRFRVKANGPDSIASGLSGGNLQKFIVGREIHLSPKVLLVSQPTWGVDVGAAAYIRQTLIDLSRSGKAVIVISEEVEELYWVVDRIYVMADGKLSKSIDRKTANIEDIGLLMTSGAEYDYRETNIA